MMIRGFSVLVFLVGLIGFAALLWGVAQWSVPVAAVIGGAVAMWWSWYVSLGAQMQMRKLEQAASKGEG